MSDGLKIYVACLSSYNEGRLHGRWIELEDKDIEDVRQEISDMLAESSSESIAEEFAIHDSEGFHPLKISEHESLDDVLNISNIVEEYGEVALHVLDNHGLKYREYVRELFEGSYEGAFESKEAWAEQKLELLIALTNQFRDLLNKQFERVWMSRNYQMDNIGMYLEFQEDKWARDINLGGYADFYEVDGEVHVFWN
jgi:antirestriction protein